MNLVKEYRKAKGISQKELADELRPIVPTIDNVLISKMETGACSPSYEVMEYLFSAFANGVSEEKDWWTINSSTNEFPPLKMSNSAYAVLRALGDRTKESAASRQELSNLTGICDRNVRAAIEELRKNGFRIMSNSRSKGYWIARTSEEYRELRNEYIARIRSCTQTLKAMDESVPGQMTIGGLHGR